MERGRSGLSFTHKFQFHKFLTNYQVFNFQKFVTKNRFLIQNFFYSKLKTSTLTIGTAIKIPRLERGRTELTFTHKFQFS